nr:RNA-directed DNA polymerase, eukaryota [Tanacetum cinerariifolium]
MNFHNILTLEQQSDIEGDVSNAEIKNAVWDCGTDKAPAPDGFSFGFYRRFWYLIEKGVCDAVKYFFYHGEFPNGYAGLFHGLQLGDSANLSHMFYADDAVFVGQWSEGGIMSKTNAWNDVVDKVKNRLSKWKMKMLSIGGGAEQQQLEEMLTLVNSISLAPMADKMYWDLDSAGDFSVASVRKMIDDRWLTRSDSKTRWINYIPIKINVLTWKIMSNAIPSGFNISKMGICISCIKSVLCDEGIETTSHLLFSCSFVRSVYRLISFWWDIPERLVEDYEGSLGWMDNIKLPHKNKKFLEGIFYIMWWLLWNFRNKTIFETKAPLKVSFFDNVVSKSFLWCRHRCKASFNLNDWLKNPNLIVL